MATDVKDPLLSEEGGKAKQANYSDFMRRKVELEPKGKKVNACPFGCLTEELDDRGYCHHLVGFSNEDLGVSPVHPQATPRTVMEVLLPPDEDDRLRRRKVLGEVRVPVKRSDVLVRVTNNYRVYREGGIDEVMLERETDPATSDKKPAVVTA
jgi:hypothetical protein